MAIGVRAVEERGALLVAHFVLTSAGQVWRYAAGTGRAQRNVSADIKGALKRTTANNLQPYQTP